MWIRWLDYVLYYWIVTVHPRIEPVRFDVFLLFINIVVSLMTSTHPMSFRVLIYYN